MTNPFTGVRGRVTFLVLAVTACLYSLLSAVGFVRIASSGRADIRERVTHVMDELEASLRSGSRTVTVSTPDGVVARASDAGATGVPHPKGEVTIERVVTISGASVRLIGQASEARLTSSLHSLWRGIWIGVPLAAIISALMAGFATHRALRPVKAIAELAETIGADDTGARVPVPATGDEIEQLAGTVNRMLDRIDAGRTAQRQFSSDAAHELRTPLMALQGELELAGHEGAALDGSFVERLTAQAARIGARVDDLVLLSTLDERPPLVREPTSVLELLRHEAAAVDPDATVVGDEATVAVDRALVERAVRNLLANARRHRRAAVRASVESVPGRVWIHVDDDGDGIDPAKRADVFRRFARLDAARTADGGGSGLGLSIVASVAAAHGGGVEVADSPLGGARLSMWLPDPPQ